MSIANRHYQYTIDVNKFIPKAEALANKKIQESNFRHVNLYYAAWNDCFHKNMNLLTLDLRAISTT